MTRMFQGEPVEEKRSRHMANIGGKNTKPELALRRTLWRAGARYRLHRRGLPGIPDVSHQGAKVAVFVDGCFWHGCPRHYTAPKTRATYWKAKVQRNIAKRQEVRQELKDWRVYELFECQLREDPELALRIANEIRLRRPKC